jgi:hypothetical protein
MTQHAQPKNQADTPPRIETAEEALGLCDRLMETTADLIAVLERETGLLRKANVKDLTAVHVRKQSLSVALHRDLALLRENSEFIKMAAIDKIGDLKAQQIHFHKSLAANQNALSAVRAVSEQLLQTIASKVHKSQNGPEVYGRDAGVGTGDKRHSGAIAVDTTL